MLRATIYTSQNPNTDAALIDVALQIRDAWEKQHPRELVDGVDVHRSHYGHVAVVHRSRRRMFRAAVKLPDEAIAVTIRPAADLPVHLPADVETIRTIDHTTGRVYTRTKTTTEES